MPVYTMYAEPDADPGTILWHVLAKDPEGVTLCGRHASQTAQDPDTGVERYCDPCMAAFRAALG
ncbi:hypothetical protein [Streptomyces sp. RerS4]|uniref:hypothetical protein n=1 Tax=Streptomyces sp. RerS4 TaxID=2942449 RepID=UPI00201B99CE|nr:hypothetical protein [Streptomyces sp. RerS4]UQW99590.1 hypothetical protein M4D82_02850 [Streptomyces sp. RerS4]